MRELSIAQLAVDTGISASTLSCGERGLLEFTDTQQDILAKYFKVRKADLMRPAVVRTEVA